MKKENEKTMYTTRPIVLVLALLCFSLPLFNIKCSSPMGGDLQIASVTGTALVTGGSIAPNEGIADKVKKKSENLFKTDKEEEEIADGVKEEVKTETTTKKKDKDNKKDVKPNFLAIGSLLCIIAALAFSFIKIKNSHLYSFIASALAVLCLIALAFTIKSFLDLKEDKGSSMDFDIGLIKVVPAMAYYLIVLLTLAAATISYLFHKKEKDTIYVESLEKELLQTPVSTTSDVDTTHE
jgi:hypothetical protein